MKFNYSIHNILKIISNVDLSPRIPKHFRVNFVQDPDIIVKKEKIEFSDEIKQKLGLRFYGGNGKLMKFYPLAEKYGFTPRIILENLEGKTKIRFTDWYQKLKGIERLTSTLYFIKTWLKGFVFVHASAISFNGKGVLMTGWSDTGKSSTVLSLLSEKDNRVKFMADDIVILDGDGMCYCFPALCKIHPTTTHTFKLNLNEKFNLYSKAYISLIPFIRRFISPGIGIDLIDRGVPIKDKAKLEYLFFLERPKNGEKYRELSKEEAFKRLLLSTDNGTDYLIDHDFIQSYSYLNGLDLQELREKQLQIMKESISKAKIFEIFSYKQEFPEIIKEMIETN